MVDRLAGVHHVGLAAPDHLDLLGPPDLHHGARRAGSRGLERAYGGRRQQSGHDAHRDGHGRRRLPETAAARIAFDSRKQESRILEQLRACVRQLRSARIAREQLHAEFVFRTTGSAGTAPAVRCAGVAAARPKFSSSATATKYRSLRMSRSGASYRQGIALRRKGSWTIGQRPADSGGMSLKNSRVLVIGGTSGIGLGVATAAAERGAVPIVVSRRQSSVDARAGPPARQAPAAPPSISPTRHRWIGWPPTSATSNTWCSPRASHWNWPAGRADACASSPASSRPASSAR